MANDRLCDSVSSSPVPLNMSKCASDADSMTVFLRRFDEAMTIIIIIKNVDTIEEKITKFTQNSKSIKQQQNYCAERKTGKKEQNQRNKMKKLHNEKRDRKGEEGQNMIMIIFLYFNAASKNNVYKICLAFKCNF